MTARQEAIEKELRYALHDQGDDAIDTRYSIFDGDEIVLLFNMPLAGHLRAQDVVDAFNRADALSANARELAEARAEKLPNGADLSVIRKAYMWAIDVNGHVMGLVAGDMGFDETGIVIDQEHLEASKLAVASAERERDEAMAALREKEERVKALEEALFEEREMSRGLAAQCEALSDRIQVLEAEQ